MAKTIKLEPISQETVVQTDANILSALLDNRPLAKISFKIDLHLS